MGTIQLEVLASILKTRFGLEASFGRPAVIYKETPKTTGEGFEAYTMPKPCWAVIRLLIEPGERGTGLIFQAKVAADKILPRYQNHVEKCLPNALKQGLYGWEVTDLKVTLIYGESHNMHTHPLDLKYVRFKIIIRTVTERKAPQRPCSLYANIACTDSPQRKAYIHLISL